MNLLIYLILGCLATYRVTYMVQFEYGPGGIFDKLRKAAGLILVESLPVQEQIMYAGTYTHNDEFFAQLIECHKCLSIWVGALLASTLVFAGVINFWLLPVCAFVFSLITIIMYQKEVIDE